MARPAGGQVTERAWADGETTTFGARIYAYGERHRLVFGTNAQGWNRRRAEIEIELIQRQVLHSTWEPRSRAIKEASARGKPLTETVTTKSGRTYRRRKRALSNTSIN